MWINDTRVIANYGNVSGDCRVQILARPDGLYFFRHEEWNVETIEPTGEILAKFWNPIYTSGLYSSQEDAEKDAATIVRWLKQ